MANIWIQHCKQYATKHPDLKWAQVLKEAKASYEKKGSKKSENEIIEKKSSKKKENKKKKV